MTSKFFDRRWEILLDGEIFIRETAGQQFKATFEIVNDFGGYVSYAEIAIYNLSQDTIQKAFRRDVTIGLRAGYIDGIDFIFRGRINNIIRTRSGPNTITRIIARGGSQPATQRISETLGKDTTIVDVIRRCAASLGYPLVIQPSDFNNILPYARGFAMNGDPRSIMDRLAEAHRFSYIIENDRIVVVGENSFRQGQPRVIDQFSGMEGIPEITENGADVSVRLSPNIRIGGRIDIQSELATFNFSNLFYNEIPESAGRGIYKIFRVTHSGDTWGDAWTTRITGFR